MLVSKYYGVTIFFGSAINFVVKNVKFGKKKLFYVQRRF